MDKTGVLLSVIFLLAFSLSFVASDVISLGTLINWEDERTHSIFDVMIRFNQYGCYCGFGGHGYPVDEIDCCCQDHDECYERLKKNSTCVSGNSGVGMVYKYTKINNNGKHTVVCEPSLDKCAEGICECDKELADCFSTNEPKYNSKHTKHARDRLCAQGTGLRANFCPNFNSPPE